MFLGNPTDIGVGETIPDGNRSRNSGAGRSFGNEGQNDSWPCSRSTDRRNIEDVSMLQISSDWEQYSPDGSGRACSRVSSGRLSEAGRRNESGALGHSSGAGRRNDSNGRGTCSGANIEDASMLNISSDWERNSSDGNGHACLRTSGRSSGAGRNGESGSLGRSLGAGRRNESGALGRSIGAGSRYTPGANGQCSGTNDERNVDNVNRTYPRNDWRRLLDGNDSARSAHSRRSLGAERRENTLNDPFCSRTSSGKR